MRLLSTDLVSLFQVEIQNWAAFPRRVVNYNQVQVAATFWSIRHGSVIKNFTPAGHEANCQATDVITSYYFSTSN